MKSLLTIELRQTGLKAVQKTRQINHQTSHQISLFDEMKFYICLKVLNKFINIGEGVKGVFNFYIFHSAQIIL